MPADYCNCVCCLDTIDGCAYGGKKERCDPYVDEHSCPYQREINNNNEFTCTCCDCKRHECAMSI